MSNRGEKISFLVINIFALLSTFLSAVSSSTPFHLRGLATVLGRELRGVELDKTWHSYKNIYIITFSVTKFLPLLLINCILKRTCLCPREMNTSKTQGYEIAHRMHCNYKYPKNSHLRDFWCCSNCEYFFLMELIQYKRKHVDGKLRSLWNIF